MQSSTPTWRVPLWSWAPISLGIVAETVSNGLRAYGLGQHLEHFTIRAGGFDLSLSGWVMVLAALAISLSQSRAWWIALTPGETRQRIIAGLTGTLLLAISISAMASHILEAQRAKTGDEAGAARDYLRAEEAHKAAKDAYDSAKAEIDALGTPRAVAIIQAEVQATKIDMRIWRRSAQCTDISKDDTKEACGPILALYKERGAAARKTELEPQLAALRADVAAKAAGLARQQKPKAEATDTESLVVGWWAWIMGLGVVMIATFGPVLFATVTSAAPDSPAGSRPEAGAKAPPTKTPPRGGKRGRKVDPNVISFARHFRMRTGRAPGGSDIQAAFPGMPKSTAYDYAQRVA